MSKTENKPQAKGKISGKTVQITLAALGILLSLLLLFVRAVTLEMLCYMFCGMLITVGIIGIVGFFVKGFSLRLQEYGFTGGVLLVLLGIIGMLRTQQTTDAFLFFMGLGTLILGIMLLQNTLTLRAANADRRFWIACLVLTVISLGLNFFWLSNISSARDAFQGRFVYISVLLTSLMSIAGLVLTELAKRVKTAPASAPKGKKGSDAPVDPEAAFTPVPSDAPDYTLDEDKPDSSEVFPAASGNYFDSLNAINSDEKA